MFDKALRASKHTGAKGVPPLKPASRAMPGRRREFFSARSNVARKTWCVGSPRINHTHVIDGCFLGACPVTRLAGTGPAGSWTAGNGRHPVFQFQRFSTGFCMNFPSFNPAFTALDRAQP